MPSAASVKDFQSTKKPLVYNETGSFSNH